MSETIIYSFLVVGCAGIFLRAVLFFRGTRKLKFSAYKKAAPMGFTPFVAVANFLVQFRLFKAGRRRWAAHFLVFSGFVYLIFIHGLHQFTSSKWFYDYQPTLDPFQFLRNLAAVSVIVGCGFFILRRFSTSRINQDKRFRFRGLFSVFLVFFAVASGVLLEAGKIISEPVFTEMVEEYSDIEPGSDLDDLKMLWHEKFGVIFEEMPEITAAGLENGVAVNENYCLYCHSDSRSAFLSMALAKLVREKASFFNHVRVDQVLYSIHLSACLVLLALLPFSKMLHIITIPLASARKRRENATNSKAAFQMPVSSLFACTECGFCSQVCSVYPHFQVTGNRDALPHSKVRTLKDLVSIGKTPDLLLFQQGNGFCTRCGRCTQICPSGIDLQSFWVGSGLLMKKMGVQSPAQFFLDNQAGLDDKVAKQSAKKQVNSALIGGSDDFESCIQCTICTNVCPVVDHDADDNDYTPQQVMNLLRLGLDREAESSRMVWTCLTCYACQEACPQCIRVTDVLLELRCRVDGAARFFQQHRLESKNG